MTISALGRSAVALGRAVNQFTTSREHITEQSTQLSTGRAATTYAGLGTGAPRSLGLRSQLASLSSYEANIADGQVRLTLMTTGVEQASKLGQSLVTGLSDSLDVSKYGATGYVATPADGLSQVIDALNENLNGRYLFAGRAADTKPVADYGTIMDGGDGRIGLKQLMAERKAADLGSDGLGRLAITTDAATATSTLGETVAGLPFGFKIVGASATGPGLAATHTATPPAGASFAAGPGLPRVGDEVAVTLALPDGTERTLRLTAATTTSRLTFAIGATPADTARNISDALGAGVRSLANSALAAASTMATANNFFASTAANPPLRVSGVPAATATVLAADATVVQWYRGDTSASPRDAALVRVGDGETVRIGAEANEEPFRRVLAAFAVLAAEDFTPVTAVSQARYAELAGAVKTSLGTPAGATLRAISTDLAIAGNDMGRAQKTIDSAQAQATDALAGVEDADPTETAAKLLATQTRLQASYQVTATILKLSMVDYL